MRTPSAPLVGSGLNRSAPRRLRPVLLLLALSLTAPACNVPVFRYALERWTPALYEAVLFHRGSLLPTQKALVEELERSARDGALNLGLVAVDLADATRTNHLALWRGQTNAALPWLVLRPPEGAEAAPLWAGPFVVETIRALVQSPARAELARRLLQGQAAVWLLLEGGAPAEDNSVASLLETELSRLAREITLPEPAPDDPQMRANLPTAVRFSVLRLRRDDPAEQGFAKLLFGLVNDEELTRHAVAFPVFGRGRSLAAIPAREITPRLIREATAFLCGACSCEVKEMNPGKDLLLTANWDSIFDGPAPAASKPELPAAVLVSPSSPTQVVVTAEPASPPRKMRALVPRRVLLLALGLTGLLALLTGLLALRARARSR